MVQVVERAMEWVKRRPRQRFVVFTALVSILYWVLSSGYGFMANVLGIPYAAIVNPTAAVPFVLGVVLGATGAWSVLFGYFIAKTVTMTAGLETVFVALAHGYLAFVGHELTTTTGVSTSRLDRRLPWKPQLSTILGAGGIAVAGAGAVIAWGYEVAGIGPFYVAVVVHFVEYGLSTLIFGLPVLAVLGVLISNEQGGSVVASPLHATPNDVPVRLIALATLVWIGLGGAISLGYRVFERVPAVAFLRRDLEILLVFRQPDILGLGAGRVLVLLGGIMFPMLLWGIASNRGLRETHR